MIVLNSESCYHFYSNLEFRQVIQECDAICIDGIGVRLSMLLRGYNLERYHGPDLLSDIISTGLSKSYTLVGGSSKLHQDDVINILSSHIQLPISSDTHGLALEAFESLMENSQVDLRILVSLGLPKQELFARKIKSLLEEQGLNPTIIPLGAAIDFQFGLRRRSSRVWQVAGLEWLPRLLREPRMFPRIINSILGLFMLISERR